MTNRNSYRDEAQGTRKRRVTTPEVIEQPMTWAERRASYTRTRAPRSGNRRIKRTLAQTGYAAPEGTVRVARRMPNMPQQRTPVPARASGQHPRRRGFWRRFLTLFSLTALALLAVGFALFSPNFRVRQVAVTGTTNAALIHTIEHMGMQGQNIFLIDVNSYMSGVSALPMVASASIQKEWPDQLAISVVERLPVLLWQTPQATFSVDSHGVVIGLASQTQGASHLMTVVDARTKKVTQQTHPGTHLNAGDIAFALQALEQLPQVTGITAFTLRYSDGAATTAGEQNSGGGTFIVQSQQGWIAYLGSANDANPLENRLVELQQILSNAQKQQLKLATIDLRYGLRPVFTVKTS